MTTSAPSVLSAKYWQLDPLDTSPLVDIKARIDNKTKPLGSLGQLEKMAEQLALIQQNSTSIEVNHACVLVFAADHGVASHPISIAPQAVTEQMVHNFLAGGAAINCFCKTSDVQLKVIDAGVITPIESQSEQFISKRISDGTRDLSTSSAMSDKQLEQALLNGQSVAKQQIEMGSNVLAFGEMGIGNTTSAAALLSVLYHLPAAQTAGKGTGINDLQYQQKVTLIDQAIQRTQSEYSKTLGPFEALKEVGGFEIAQMVSAMLTAAEAQKTIIVDGFIVSMAALVATHIEPNVRDYMIFSHCSAEQAHQLILQKLNATPLLDLGLRLGEGTGAALAIPLLRAAAEFYNHMATFDSAAVTLD